ncbi:MAG: type II secretion system F family protein [Bryobacteraceae bacterium]
MPSTYHFRAMTADGKSRAGTLSAESERLATQELRRQGLLPVYIGPRPPQRREWSLPRLKWGRRRDVLFFTQEIATLLGAGIPLDRALSITSELTEHETFRTCVNEVLRALKGGRSFGDALGTRPDYFSDIYVSMVRAGEATGSLAAIFERLSEYERTHDELRGYIISSMVYPALLTTVGLASITLLMYYVVPRFASVFADSHMKIPVPTQILLKTSEIVKAYGPWALLGLAAAAAALRLYVRTPAGRLWWDGSRLRVPLLGDVIRKAQSAQFARAMGTLIANGVPLVQSLTISRAIMTNRRMSDALEIVAQGIKRGEGVSAPLTRSGQFPALLAHLIQVGEETGRLDVMFLRAAEIYEADTRAAIKRFTSLFEPLIILFMGVVIGSLILSLMLAITSLNDVVM